MKKYRLISWVLSISILAGLTCGYAFAEEEMADVPATAVTDTEVAAVNDKDINLLISLGIFDNEWLDTATEPVARLSAAKALVRLSGIQPSAASTFGDVQGTDLEFASAACQMEYLNAFDDNTFHPAESIDYAQAIKAVVMILGYDSLAKLQGGYITASQRLNILDGVKRDSSITYNDFAKLLVNSLWTGVMSPYVKEDKMLIEDKLNVEKRRGIVISAGGKSMIDSSMARDDIVVIDNLQYETKNDYSDLVGFRVDYYVQTVAGEEYVVYAENADKLNKTLVIDAEDLISYSERTYHYYKKSRISNATVSEYRTVIYNNRKISTYGIDELIPTNGNVRLIDNDSDGKYDVIDITAFDTYVLSAVNKVDKTVFDGLQGTSICADDYARVKVYIDGKSSDFTALSANHTISTMFGNNNELLTIYASSKSVKGVIDGIEIQDGIIEEITVDGVKYPVLKDYFAKYGNKDMISIGDTGDFNLDHLGRIAAVTKSTSRDEKYAFLIKAVMDDDIEAVQFKMFDESNKLIRLQSAQKVKIDGRKVELSDIVDSLKYGESTIRTQLIKYKTNDEGLLTEIDTAYNYVSRESGQDFRSILPQNGESKDSFRMIARTEENAQTGWFSTGYNFFGTWRKFCFSTDSIVFVVPSEPQNAGETDFQVLPAATYFIQDKQYCVDAYSSSENYLVSDALVVQDTVIASDKVAADKDRIAMISGLQTVMTEDGIGCEISLASGNKIYALKKEHFEEVYPYDDKIPGTSKLGKGDVICYKANTKNEVTAMRIILDVSEDDPAPGKQYKGCATARFYDAYDPHIVYGDVYDRFGDVFSFCLHNLEEMDKWAPGSDNPNRNPETAEGEYFGTYQIKPTVLFYVYDKSNKTVRKGSMDDMLDYVHFGHSHVRCLYSTHKSGYPLWGAFIIKD